MPIKMKHFKPEEFGEYWGLMDDDLLIVIDKFRTLWGRPVRVSPAKGAIGRTTGSSFHNYVLHGKVKAIDLMPSVMYNVSDRRHAFDCAEVAGATGIGLYPHWRPYQGIHIDIGERPGRGVGNPARWAGILREGKQVYVAIEEVL